MVFIVQKTVFIVHFHCPGLTQILSWAKTPWADALGWKCLDNFLLAKSTGVLKATPAGRTCPLARRRSGNVPPSRLCCPAHPAGQKEPSENQRVPMTAHGVMTARAILMSINAKFLNFAVFVSVRGWSWVVEHKPPHLIWLYYFSRYCCSTLLSTYCILVFLKICVCKQLFSSLVNHHWRCL
jgi:hypothetical protein